MEIIGKTNHMFCLFISLPLSIFSTHSLANHCLEGANYNNADKGSDVTDSVLPIASLAADAPAELRNPRNSNESGIII